MPNDVPETLANNPVWSWMSWKVDPKNYQIFKHKENKSIKSTDISKMFLKGQYHAKFSTLSVFGQDIRVST